MNKEKFIQGLSCCLLILLLAGNSAATAERPIKLLFIGNSLTYGNSLPSMLEAMANSDGTNKVQVSMVTIGGAALAQHWFAGRALAAIQQGGWDYVILQEYSALGPTIVNGNAVLANPETFYAFATLFHNAIQKTGAQTALMLTWARQQKTGDQAVLNHAYAQLATALDAQLIPVGPVWQQVRQQAPGLALYLDDGLHPAAAGTYVAASVLYAHLLGDSILGQSATVMAPRFDHTGTHKSTTPRPLVTLADHHAALIQTLAVDSVNTLPALLQHALKHPPQHRQAPALPSGDSPKASILGQWSGQLAYFMARPATLTLSFYPQGKQWSVKQKIVFNNGDTLQATYPVAWQDNGHFYWGDSLTGSYFYGVFHNNKLTGHIHSFRSAYRQSGSRFGRWALSSNHSL
ncbi:SGNH/GDSL hydrolase family protein [Oceanicoccus sagamiensis]|uniref:SGNH hydrolase-type esterase domain-containing protein n=1 Tax=Oceanicoccus sagamiensis TaxID=716816 RepID=A0A1X9N6S4_9GAMM|nr:SGNH/GDSL hydrolase family protein [Oceanicoccus sagamiensis]ARN73798.1 hypothetical protein BST96_06535 [Oceanicoccus sagamiensis]